MSARIFQDIQDTEERDRRYISYSGNQAAGTRPAGGSNALAPGAVAGGADPAAALDAGAVEGEDSAPVSPAAAAAQPRMLKTASPGVERGVDVRVRLASGMFGEGVVTGRRNLMWPTRWQGVLIGARASQCKGIVRPLN